MVDVVDEDDGGNRRRGSVPPLELVTDEAICPELLLLQLLLVFEGEVAVVLLEEETSGQPFAISNSTSDAVAVGERSQLALTLELLLEIKKKKMIILMKLSF